MRRFMGLIALITGMLLMCCAPASALARSKPRPTRTLVLHPRFHLVANEAGDVVASGPYLFFTTTTSTPANALAGETGTLINSRSGTRTTLTPPACQSFADPLFGGPWLQLTCEDNSGNVELYNLATHRWRTVSTSCTANKVIMGGCSVLGVGAHWIRLEFSCYHCRDRFEDQNLGSGKVRSDPEVAGGRTIADLDSPKLARTLCRPLRVPTSAAPTPDNETEPGFLTEAGRFAVASVFSRQAGPSSFLEQCGSHRHRPLPAQSDALNMKAVLWMARARVKGLLLPSLRPVTVDLPSGVSGAPVLGGSTLYLGYTASSGLGTQGKLWVAHVPRL
jgi:hypothetical protein